MLGSLKQIHHHPIGKIVRHVAGAAVNIVFPPHCAFCGLDLSEAPRQPSLCSTCRLALQPPLAGVCQRCAAPLPSQAATGATTCPRCQKERPAFTRVFALGAYRAELREAVLRMKLEIHEPLIRATGVLLAERVAAQLTTSADCVVPMPMHWTRQLARGINQAEQLATAVAGRLKLPKLDKLIKSVRKTKKQGTLGRNQRTANMRGAIAVSSDYDMNHAKILLVDDVLTTGASANEAAKVCLRAGASQVSVAVVARGLGLT